MVTPVGNPEEVVTPVGNPEELKQMLGNPEELRQMLGNPEEQEPVGGIPKNKNQLEESRRSVRTIGKGSGKWDMGIPRKCQESGNMESRNVPVKEPQKKPHWNPCFLGISQESTLFAHSCKAFCTFLPFGEIGIYLSDSWGCPSVMGIPPESDDFYGIPTFRRNLWENVS